MGVADGAPSSWCVSSLFDSDGCGASKWRSLPAKIDKDCATEVLLLDVVHCSVCVKKKKRNDSNNNNVMLYLRHSATSFLWLSKLSREHSHMYRCSPMY